MKLTILGCYSATPHSQKNPTAQLLEIRGHHFLIDCGEGTQVQLRKAKAKFSEIKHIFISHLHGDHFFGLAGLISSFRLLGREAELHVYGPKGIKEAITLLLKLGNSWTNYPLHFHELTSTTSEMIYEDNKVTVYTIPLDHRVYTNGFLFVEKEHLRKLDVDAANTYGIDKSQYNNIKQGKDGESDSGDRVANELLTFDPPPPKRYAYCSDTAYNPSMIPIIEKATALYHESTFLESHLDLAKKTKHATAKQAASIAKMAQVGTLILGHYSSRYKRLDDFKTEANAVFANVELASDGKVFSF